jgi:hypothetical protein
MKQKISWQERYLTSTSLQHLDLSCQESSPGLDEQKSQKNNGNP